MSAFLVKRLGFAIVTLWAVLSLVFVVVRIVPGDPAQVILGAVSYTHLTLPTKRIV